MSATETRPAPDPVPASQDRTRWPGAGRILVAVLVLAGACVLLYPTAARWYTSIAISHASDHYQRTIQEMPGKDRAAALRAARAYNRSLADGTIVTDPFAAVSKHTTPDDDPYWKLLDSNGTGVMGLIRIPSIDVSLPIYHGTADDVLREGVGHLRGTALPVGGAGTHAVLAGHRGLPEATLFNQVDKVKVGDLILLDVFGDSLAYRVTDTRVVLPTQTATLAPVPGKDLITLVTCTPIGINSHRILVTAERTTLPPSEAAAARSVHTVAFPWWAVGMGALLLVLAGYLFRRRPRRAVTAARR